MVLMRYEPFQEMNILRRQMNRLFDDFFTPMEQRENGLTFSPAAELYETDAAVHLKLEVPGLEPKDLDVQVMQDAVLVKGDRKSEIKTEENGVTRSEFRYGKFQRVFPLPARINNQEVQADYKDGILTLTLPKLDEEKNKVVKVNLG